MKKVLKVTVYSDRNHVGKISVMDGDDEVQSFEVAAAAHDALENISHPQIGDYKLLNTVDVPGDQTEAQNAYGSRIMYFIKNGSKAKEDVLIVHGGELGEDGRLVATEGGLRLSNEDFEALAELVQSEGITQLSIEEKEMGFFKHFTTSRVSSTPPRSVSSSYFNNSNRQQGQSSSSFTDSPFFWMWLYDDFLSSSSSSSSHGFAGFGGGQFSGGGATGSFADQGTTVKSDDGKVDINGTNPIIVDPYDKSTKQDSVSDQGTGGNFQTSRPEETHTSY